MKNSIYSCFRLLRLHFERQIEESCQSDRCARRIIVKNRFGEPFSNRPEMHAVVMP